MNADIPVPYDKPKNINYTNKEIQTAMTSEDHIQLLLRRYLKNKNNSANS